MGEGPVLMNADAAAWVLANKVKTSAAIVITLASLLGTGFAVKAWAEDQTAEQVRESEIRLIARQEVINDSIRNRHAYDQYAQEAEDAEEDLVELEQQVAEGVTLLPSQVRKMGKLTKDIERFEVAKNVAFDRLSNPENHDETSTE